MKDVIVIGAGIAGLSAGFELYKENLDFQILETSDRIGGSIETLKINDYLIETGPHTFSSHNLDLFLLIKELGMEDALLEANPTSKNRYVYLNNKLTPIPTKPNDFFKSDILTKDSKWTLFEELFIKKENKEETVEDFISRRFGREVLKNLIQPFLNGVYAGDVRKLSADAVFPKLKALENRYNSVLLGFILSKAFKSLGKMTLYSFIDGMEMLCRELYERLKNKISLGIKDIEISRAKDFYIVTFKINNKTITHTTNSVLFAIPSYKVPEYSNVIPKEYISDFYHIEYVPIAAVSQVTDKSRLKSDLNGFGFLCVKEPHRKLLGTIWTSSIFPTRAPSNKVLLTSYIGGAHYKKITEQTNEEISTLVAKEVAETLHISDPNYLETIHVKVHTNAIPQYNMGHIEKVRRINELMGKNYGLFFAGNYLYGISLNDTIKSSRLVIQKIKNFLNTNIKKQELLIAK